MNAETYSLLRSNVSYLGRVLGETMSEADGPEFLEKIEKIRLLSKSARSGSASDREKLHQELLSLEDNELVPVARAFSQFLNLANIADQHHTIARSTDDHFSATGTLRNIFDELRGEKHSADRIVKAVENLSIELVLTAHPTEITRRTLIHKHSELDRALGMLELKELTEVERDEVDGRIRELIAQVWHTHDFRRVRPTPVEEAKWGFAVVENSLWRAVPQFLRRLDKTLFAATGQHLPLDVQPVKFSSWIGGDRDGNPNVTAQVTAEVLLTSKWQALELYLRDLDPLIEELSISACNDGLLQVVGSETREPYRVLLRNVRSKLREVKVVIEKMIISGDIAGDVPLLEIDELLQPLILCYDSLVEKGMAVIANGKLLDLLRCARCFGVHLVQLDVRQDSSRHTDAIAALVDYLQLGDYYSWSEAEKMAFLVSELDSRRPLIPQNWQTNEDVQEVLDTFRVVAANAGEGIGAYVISMARQPSDILAVELLLKATGCTCPLPVVPLFETLDDLNRAPAVIEQLLQLPGYAEKVNHALMIMIGYSDSAKDAGMLAAAWAQYKAQESLLAVCSKANVSLRLFHGRGGTIGRGGAPAREALLSQPPGSLSQGLRVTEQGEMIRTKLGLTALAVKTLALYSSAIIQANVNKPPVPPPAWREVMDQLADSSCRQYRSFVRDNPNFVEYFRQATPEQELARLPLGSRPARRKTGGGIESLRAIPWIFAWMQNRLMLPAWLGAGHAIGQLLKGEIGTEDGGKILEEMALHWPFFATRLSMLDMVYAKTDSDLSAYYDSRLVDDEHRHIGEQLRQRLATDIQVVSKVTGDEGLMAQHSWARESIELRNIYTDPLNVLQVELLSRSRGANSDPVEQALMVSIAGVAAGMRNTG